MQSNRREIVEAILFLPAMVLLCAVVFAGMYAVIVYGGWVLTELHLLLSRTVGLPKPVALAIAVIGTALVVYATVPRALSLAGDFLNRN